MDGFVPLNRRILEWSIWKKPPYYFKIFSYLLLRAAYRDTPTLKRGQVETTREELRKQCEAGRGKSKTEITPQALFNILSFLENDFPECPIHIQKSSHGSMLVTFLRYDDLIQVKQPRRMAAGYTEDASAMSEGCAEDARRMSSYKYNNNKNTKQTDKDKYKTSGGGAPQIKRSRFNNFSSRSTDYGALLEKKKAQIKQLLKEEKA